MAAMPETPHLAENIEYCELVRTPTFRCLAFVADDGIWRDAYHPGEPLNVIAIEEGLNLPNC
jgi:hypothetical protein